MNFIRNRNFRAGPQTSLEGFICPQNSDKQQKIKVFGRSDGGALSAKQQTSADSRTESLQPLSDERRDFIQKSLDAWCANLGYKDSTVNMLTLSRTLCISKDELSVFFDQYLKTTFRIWLGDIRFTAAKKMMLEFPDYSNDIISAECGFSARTYLYRIFKSKEGCTPTEWREEQVANAAPDDEKQD